MAAPSFTRGHNSRQFDLAELPDTIPNTGCYETFQYGKYRKSKAETCPVQYHRGRTSIPALKKFRNTALAAALTVPRKPQWSLN